ncbi:MAG: meaC [Alphaproteobacteria bacterium]|jgi:2-methylfumaryl-CoA hydratase|nr:meaC [Alphaproteobacteria bacterium]
MSDKTKTAKTNLGNFFEDFRIGQELRHATPRTVSAGDAAVYMSLYGSRFALSSAATFAQSIGFPHAPLDELLGFHIVFGKTVPDVSLNAIANLGYAACHFGAPIYPGDTVHTVSTVIGLRENSNRQSGVVYVHSIGRNQHGAVVLEWNRWVMVRKRDANAAAPAGDAPKLPAAVSVDQLHVPRGLQLDAYDYVLAGSPHRFGDYRTGEKIDHVDGTTIEEAEHAMATRLYQNTAKVHFNQHSERQGRFGKRLVYGGHIISIARALSFNGLANAFRIAAINAGSHVAPCFAGDTIYAWSEVLDTQPIPARNDLGALRLRTIAAKDHPCADFPHKTDDGKSHAAVVLDLDYWVLMPR